MYKLQSLKVSPPDIYSKIDFPTFAPYSDAKKSKWKFKPVPKTSWQRIDSKKRVYTEQLNMSEITVQECLFEKPCHGKLKVTDPIILKMESPCSSINTEHINKKKEESSYSVSIFYRSHEIFFIFDFCR